MRKQRAFASLTEPDIDQIAEWLRHDTYDKVRERIAKPRPEGFALALKSTRPLETLWQKKNTVDKINAKLETGQKLTLAEFESIAAGEKTDLPEQIHNAILETTYDRVLEDDNTPTQLLALQRLADFPARADYREHKIQMDLHRKEMAEHRKHIANERLAISHRLARIREEALTLKKSRAQGRTGAPPVVAGASPADSFTTRQRQSDDVGPIATTVEELQARTRRAFGHKPFRPPVQTPPVKEFPTPPLINTGIHAGDRTPTLTPASVSTLSGQQTTDNEKSHETEPIQPPERS